MSREKYLVEQVRRRKSQDRKQRDTNKADELLSQLFLAQRFFVLDKSRRKAALCPRRAGKSYCVLIYALIVALRRPRANVLILAKVRKQAKAVYWGTLKQIDEEFELGSHFLNVELECHLPNGSTLRFAGADTQEEVDKYRGLALDLVVIDEGKSYSGRLLDELINEVLLPTLGDRRGTLALIGTPGSVFDGMFWAITTEQRTYKPHGAEHPRMLNVKRYTGEEDKRPYQWSLHSWSSADNVAMPHIWLDALAEKEENGWADDDPFWVRERLGRWIADDSALVYAFLKADGKCDWVKEDGPHGLPPGHEWRYLLGVDLGWHDATAFVVAAWSQTHRALHYVHVEKHSYLLPDEVARRAKELEERFGGFDARVIDTAGLGKMVAEGLAAKHGISFEPAKKQDKCAHIALFNADLTAGRIKADPEGELVEEWRTAQWGNPERTEVDRACDDHASDAALYIWRHAHHHWSREKEANAEQGSRQWYQEWERKEKKRLQEEKANGDKWQKFKSRLNALPRAASVLTRWRG